MIAENGADFTLLDPMRARVTQGVIKMRVTEKSARGFVVETPYGRVTDQGTEFGLDLTTRNQAGLVVFEGAVDLSLSKDQAQPTEVVQRLRGGEGVEFNRDGSLNRINLVFTGNVQTFQRNANQPPPLRARSPTESPRPSRTFRRPPAPAIAAHCARPSPTPRPPSPTASKRPSVVSRRLAPTFAGQSRHTQATAKTKTVRRQLVFAE